MKCVKPLALTGGAVVPCGGCIACRINKKGEWALRLSNEYRVSDKACFLTLTYDDFHLPDKGSLSQRDVQLFLKRLRKNVKKNIRYYVAGEYGPETLRPHYHGIVFGIDGSERDSSGVCLIEKSWGNGFVEVSHVNDNRLDYVAKYVIKKQTGVNAEEYVKRGVEPERAWMSRRPGIGAFFMVMYGYETMLRGYLIRKGNKVPIPRYYEKLLDDTGFLRSARDLFNREMSIKRRNESLTSKEMLDRDSEFVLSCKGRENNLIDKLKFKRDKL